MKHIGLYTQLTDFTTENAGTAEWCKAKRDGKTYFVKKFHSPVYPSKDIGLPEAMYKAGVEEFHSIQNRKKELYERIRHYDQSGFLVVPVEVLNYQFHICTVAEYVTANVPPDRIHFLSEWQRLVLMRTLTLALMKVHQAGVVHSDMKPENVLVTQDSNGNCRLRLIDFDGSFFESDPPTDPEDIVGDPAYFSPEAYMQSMDEDIRLDHRIDIFALGLIFHFFWTGKNPERPNNQTVGESLVRGDPVTLDQDIPLVLQQLILRMISKDPAKRIPLKSVYDVLGVQLGLYPPLIINLQSDRAGRTKTPKEKEPDKAREAEVLVQFCDQEGIVLRHKTIKVPYGSRDDIFAEKIDGYTVSGPARKEVRVSSDGRTASPVTFTYTKNPEKKRTGKCRKALLILGSLLIVYLGILLGLIHAAMNSSDYERAKEYMNLFPFFQELFPGDYYRTTREIEILENKRREAITENNYTKAVNEYRSGNYSKASDLFRKLDKEYRDTAKYLAFCNAHTDSSADCYAEIMEDLDFEDAKVLIARNLGSFGRYMLGSWTYSSSAGESGTVTMSESDDVFHLVGFPEFPGGGSFNVNDSKVRYKYKDTKEWVDFFSISVVSRNTFSLKSYSSQKTYTFRRT